MTEELMAPEFEFTPEIQELSIKLAAFDVMKKLCEEGKISKEELEFIAKKRGLEIEY